MTFVVYRISNKQVVKKFNDFYEAEDFLRGKSFHKRTNLSGNFYPLKSLVERDLAVASSCDVATVKRKGLEFIIRVGPNIYSLPPIETDGIFQKILNIWEVVKKWVHKRKFSIQMQDGSQYKA